MNALIDTNVILDDILGRAPNGENARKISLLVTDGLINGYLTANCLTDIFYIVSKNCNEVTAKKTIKNLLLSFAVVSVDG
ncbi:MAG: PIN domain-containing protein [Synergistaceae bacterium]|jgi:predicted nucleic acid-binding protein|nr:PIN domain-containing protein [Synergistaceae bacterium]